MEEPAAEVNPRYVSGYMVDEFPVGECGPGAGGEAQGAVVDGCNEAATEENA